MSSIFLVFDLEKDNARKLYLVGDVQRRNKMLIKPFDKCSRPAVKIKNTERGSRQAIQFRKDPVISEDVTEIGISEVVEDERKGTPSPACEMFIADFIEPAAK